VWGFVLLAPTAKKTTKNGTTSSSSSSSAADSHASPSIYEDEEDNDDEDDEQYSTDNDDETDEERFEKLYATLDERVAYRKLILPPTCRRVEVTTTHHTTIASSAEKGLHQTSLSSKELQQQQQQHIQQQPSEEDSNPAQRLGYYMKQIWLFFRAMIWFDYVGAGWTLIYWLQGIQRYRRSGDNKSENNNANTQEEGEEETVEGSAQKLEQQEVDDSDKHLPSPRSPQYHPAVAGSLHDDNNENGDTTTQVTADITNSSKESASSTPAAKTQSGHDKSFKTMQSDPLPHPASSPNPIELARSHSDYSDGGLSLASLQSQSSADDANSGMGFVNMLVMRRQQVHKRSNSKRDALDAWRTASSLNAAHNNHHNNSSSLLHVGDLPTTLELSESQDSFSSLKRSLDSQLKDNEEHSSSSTPINDTHETREEWSGNFYFDTQHCDRDLKQLSIDMPLPDKNGYILGDEFLSRKNTTPLLVFVNTRSGPQQGAMLIAQLRRLLNPIQIWDLAKGGPESVLESFLVLTRLRILVCGGDGTVSWIVSSLESMKLKRKWPPIALLPLGTGNDLARIHGWGGGYNNESLIAILEQISESYISLLDRWDVTIDDKHSKKKEHKCFMNYLGVGADAQAALQVHYLRESRPDWFFSRIVNKVWYGIFGAEDIIMASSVHVRKEIKLVADGVEIPLPQDSQGIILLNIDSYAGGVPMWTNGTKVNLDDFSRPTTPYRRSPRRTKSMSSISHRLRHTGDPGSGSMDRNDSADDLQMLTMSDEERYEHVTACDRPSSCQDGLLEIVSIRGAFHLGQIRVGLSNAQRLCQCREAVITIKNKVAVQIDGEPWKQRACTIRITRKKEHAVMLHRSMDDGGVETEMSKLLDWAEERRLIDTHVHTILMKEFSRRIESKTRQRRVREQDENLMHTLKKAISQNALASNMNLHGASHGWQGGMAF
jgi:diacylglycerol kinase (ATP)